MSESELLRQEAEQLKSVIRVGSGSRPLPNAKIIDISRKVVTPVQWMPYTG
jgi:hypothetical protein